MYLILLNFVNAIVKVIITMTNNNIIATFTYKLEVMKYFKKNIHNIKTMKLYPNQIFLQALDRVHLNGFVCKISMKFIFN